LLYFFEELSFSSSFFLLAFDFQWIIVQAKKHSTFFRIIVPIAFPWQEKAKYLLLRSNAHQGHLSHSFCL
jgi:hypothetical protein